MGWVRAADRCPAAGCVAVAAGGRANRIPAICTGSFGRRMRATKVRQGESQQEPDQTPLLGIRITCRCAMVACESRNRISNSVYFLETNCVF